MWQVKLHPEVETWFLTLCRGDPETADLVSEAVDLLAERARHWAARWWIG